MMSFLFLVKGCFFFEVYYIYYCVGLFIVREVVWLLLFFGWFGMGLGDGCEFSVC